AKEGDRRPAGVQLEPRAAIERGRGDPAQTQPSMRVGVARVVLIESRVSLTEGLRLYFQWKRAPLFRVSDAVSVDVRDESARWQTLLTPEAHDVGGSGRKAH